MNPRHIKRWWSEQVLYVNVAIPDVSFPSYQKKSRPTLWQMFCWFIPKFSWYKPSLLGISHDIESPQSQECRTPSISSQMFPFPSNFSLGHVFYILPHPSNRSPRPSFCWPRWASSLRCCCCRSWWRPGSWRIPSGCAMPWMWTTSHLGDHFPWEHTSHELWSILMVNGWPSTIIKILMMDGMTINHIVSIDHGSHQALQQMLTLRILEGHSVAEPTMHHNACW